MPQQQRRKTADQALDALLAQPLGPPRASVDQALDQLLAAPTLAPPEVGFFDNLRIGAERVGQSFFESLGAASEIAGGIATGDFRPLTETARLAGRGALNTITGLFGEAALTSPEFGGTTMSNEQVRQTVERAQAAEAQKIAAIQAEQETRRTPESQEFFRSRREAQRRLDIEAGRDPSLGGKITRRATQAILGSAPAIAAGVLSGGSIPAVAGVTALTSLDRPENLPLNVALGAAPLPAIRPFVAPVLRRIRGQSAATQAAETAVSTRVPQLTPTELADIEIRRVIDRYTNEVSRIFRANLAPETQATQLANARTVFQAERAAASPFARPQGGQPFVETLSLTPELRQQMSLGTTFQKLGTQNLDEIGDMIANANRRLQKKVRGKPVTAAERQSQLSDFERINQLTPSEHRALGAVLPERRFDPAGRQISDIPSAQAEAQLEANSRAIEEFFYKQGKALQEAEDAAILGDIGPGAFSAQAAAPGRPVTLTRPADLPTTPPPPPPGAPPTARLSAAPSLGQALAQRPGAPASLTQLREQFPSLTKPQFDAEVKRLVDEGTIFIHRHDAPGLLTEAQRNNLVKIGDEYYTAATFNPAAAPSALTPPRIQAETGLPAPGTPRTISSPALAASLRPSASVAAGARPSTPALTVGVPANPAAATAAERTKLLEVILAARKAGLVTSAKGHMKNIGGTGLVQIGDEIARMPASIMDITLSAGRRALGFGPRRTITGPSVTAFTRSAHEAATKGVREAREIMSRGLTPQDIERLGLSQPINSGSKILDTYVNGAFRLLGAEDRVFRTFALRRALEDRAASLAKTEIRQGTIPRGQYGRRVREILDKPPEDLAAAAAADAEMAVFTNDNLLTNFIETGKTAIKDKPGGRAAIAAFDLIFPFVKTPTNIIARMLEFSPAGFGKNAAQIAKAIAKRSFTDAQQRAFAQTFGRAFAGSAIVALGYKGYLDGWVSGLFEEDPARRARDEALGRKPGSIQVDGTWHQLSGFAPLANLLFVGATMAREVEREREKARSSGAEFSLNQARLKGAAKAGGQAVLEQPLLIGTEQILRGLRQPGTAAGRTLGGVAGSFVPTEVSNIAEAIDPTARQAQTFGERVAGRVPGLRQDLPEAQTVLGTPRQDIGPAQAILDPTRASSDLVASNPLFGELIRYDLGISGFDKRPNETDNAYRSRVQRFGQIYAQHGAQLASSTIYQRQPENVQRLMLRILNSRAKELVTEGREREARLALHPFEILDAAIQSVQNASAR